MVSVAEVADGIFRIESESARKRGKAGLPLTTIQYLVVGQDMALIDVGPATVLDDVLEGLRQLKCDPSALAYILPTHIHLDHAGGIVGLLAQSPKVKVAALEVAARHLINPSRLIEGTKQAFGEDFEAEYGPILPVPENRVRIVNDGESLSLGDRELTVVYAPGHASHHSMIYDSKTHGLFCGEALGNYYASIDFVEVDHTPGFDPVRALETMAKLKQLNPEVLFYSHDSYSQDVTRLVSLAEELTKGSGDLILEALRAGESLGQIIKEVKDYRVQILGGEYPVDTLSRSVEAYVAYFKRKALV